MAVELIIQETLVGNGLGGKTVPLFFSVFPVPTEVYVKKELHARYDSKRKAAQNDTNESSVVHPFPDRFNQIVFFYVSSPDKEHTANIAKAILEGFEIDYNIKE